MTTTSLFLQSSSTAGMGARSFSFLLFGGEIMPLVVDAKWFIALLVALIVADFRFGWGESHKRYDKAKWAGDEKGMATYRWHASRAIRRTRNKLVRLD